MALQPIEKKLKGIYSNNSKERNEREVSTSNLVQMLIQEATDLSNLVSFRCLGGHIPMLTGIVKDVSWMGTLALDFFFY